MRRHTSLAAGLIGTNVLAWCVLGFYGSLAAAPKTSNEPFANAVEQRAEMVEQLKELNAQVKELTALVRSGKVEVFAKPAKPEASENP